MSFSCFLPLANCLTELRLPQTQRRALINFRMPSADITSCESASKHSGAIVEHIIKRRLAYVINKKERGEVEEAKRGEQRRANNTEPKSNEPLWPAACADLYASFRVFRAEPNCVLSPCPFMNRSSTHTHTRTGTRTHIRRWRLSRRWSRRWRWNGRRSAASDISRRVYWHDIWIWQSDMDNFIGSWKALSLRWLT